MRVKKIRKDYGTEASVGLRWKGSQRHTCMSYAAEPASLRERGHAVAGQPLRRASTCGAGAPGDASFHATSAHSRCVGADTP